MHMTEGIYQFPAKPAEGDMVDELIALHAEVSTQTV